MEPVTWGDAFNTGIHKIDIQHQRIIDMVNRLLAAPDALTTSETVADVLNDMAQYAREHFETEEQLMEEHQYPGLEKHKKAHDAYRKKTIDFCADSMLGFHRVPQDLLTYLLDWWINHILSEDMKYSDFILARQNNAREQEAPTKPSPADPDLTNP